MTLDSIVEADILATCNALGSEINGEYQKGTDCIECLKDILRYLKKDSDDHGVLRYLGSIRLLQTDLLPILKKYHSDPEIFDIILRIIISLTNPAILLYKEDLPDDKISRNEYLQIISYLQIYKIAFFDVDVWKVLYEHLKDMLKMRPLERSTIENLVVERIIILVRNVLHVPPDESVLKQTDEDTSVHDKVLWSLNLSHINILLLYMCANDEEHQYCMHLLEIIFLMLREHTAAMLANTNEIRNETEKQKDLDALQAARQREQKLKMEKHSVCKPRFNGVYCIKNVKSLSENDLITHKYVSDVKDIHYDSNKNAKRRPKNKTRARDVDNTRQSTLNIRIFLKKFCLEVLKAYNKLMVSVKRELIQKISDEHDETYYFWAVKYFMQFNRLCDFQPALVSETVSTQTFHHIQTEIINYQEMMLTDKKKQLFWAKRIQLAVSAYKELLETLKKMINFPDEGVRNCADSLISHIFYVIEYRELLLSLITHYDEVKFSVSYLAELVESTQLFLKMLENHSKKHSEIVVQQKLRKVRRKKKKKQNSEPVSDEEHLQEQWDVVSRELSASVSGEKDVPEVIPFDAASELTFEEQKVEVVFKIREAISTNKPLEALGLLRAARDLWPEGDSFGAKEIDPESEINVLKEIHFSNLQRTGENSHPINEETSEEDDEEMEALPAVAEKTLDLEDVYKKYSSPKVVIPCSLLLANYQSNKPETNMCLVKLLHRIAWNCKMHALFFQSTIFLTFQKIFHDPDATQNLVIKELYRFARFIMQKFFAAAENNKKIYVEMLFWKSPRDAYEIEEGYGASEQNNKGWTEDDDEELKYLYEDNKNICIEGQDVADIILANFSKKCKRSKIILALKRLGLIKSTNDLKPEKRSEWLEEEIVDLQHLFEEYKDSEDVMSSILEKLSIKRSKKAVVDKLLELNLIQDRKQVRKKRQKKKKSQSGEMNKEQYSDKSEESSDREDSGNSDEEEINFFKNLEAERNASLNESSQLLNSEKKSSLDENKPPNIWDEIEIMELMAIFNANSDSHNIFNIIRGSLTVKRQDKEIIEKMIELGLIRNKNEICNKDKTVRAKKSKIWEKSENENQSDLDNASNDAARSLLKTKKKAMRRILSDESSDDTFLDGSSVRPSNPNADSLKDSLQVMKKKRPSRVWDESEVMELTALFYANEGSDSLMQDILKGLTVKRPKQAVAEKLLELRLITDKKQLYKKQKSKSEKLDSKRNINKSYSQMSPKQLSGKNMKKHVEKDSSDEDIPLSKAAKFKKHSSPVIKSRMAPKVWNEQEIIELYALYNENHMSNDIVRAISNSLTIKRPKSAIIEKLLELNLIKDKKEVKKKKEYKTRDSLNDSVFQSSSETKVNEQLEDSESPNTLIRKKNNRCRIVSNSSEEDQNIEAIDSNSENLVSQSGKLKNNSIEEGMNESISHQSSEPFMNEQAPNTKSPDTLVRKKNLKQRLLSESSDEDPIVIETSKAKDTILENLQSQVGKRKRIISSDDSDDDNVTNTITTYEGKAQDKPMEHSTSKIKKKLCVIDDSDESS